jgi:hypothetical protein
MPRTANVKVSPFASLAVGVKLYCWSCIACAAGEPEIVGA